MLVVEAAVALSASGVEDGFDEFGEEDLVAPPLMWSEALSALHELTWRSEVDPSDAAATRQRLERSPIVRRRPQRLTDEAWRVRGRTRVGEDLRRRVRSSGEAPSLSSGHPRWETAARSSAPRLRRYA